MPCQSICSIRKKVEQDLAKQAIEQQRDAWFPDADPAVPLSEICQDDFTVMGVQQAAPL